MPGRRSQWSCGGPISPQHALLLSSGDNAYKVNAPQISKRAALLQKHLCDEQKELQALFALQALMVHMEQPASESDLHQISPNITFSHPLEGRGALALHETVGGGAGTPAERCRGTLEQGTRALQSSGGSSRRVAGDVGPCFRNEERARILVYSKNVIVISGLKFSCPERPDVQS